MKIVARLCQRLHQKLTGQAPQKPLFYERHGFIRQCHTLEHITRYSLNLSNKLKLEAVIYEPAFTVGIQPPEDRFDTFAYCDISVNDYAADNRPVI